MKLSEKSDWFIGTTKAIARLQLQAREIAGDWYNEERNQIAREMFRESEELSAKLLAELRSGDELYLCLTTVMDGDVDVMAEETLLQ